MRTHVTTRAIVAQLACAVLTTTSLADTYHVPGDFATIQEAIDHAIDADEIVVAPGRYIENIHFDGKNVVLRATSRSVDAVDPLDPNTVSIIDGSQPSDPDLGAAVRFHGTELPACTLDGFTVTGGTGIMSTSGYTEGGGIFGGDAGATWVWTRAAIANCTVIGNSARFGGGLWQCGGVIRNCNITENWTADPGGSNHNGGGLGACNGTIVDCVISGNASYGGAGLYSCLGLIVNCDIRDNDADWSGGAMMWCDNCTVVNCNLSDNRASLGGYGAGGAIFSQRATYVNCTIANNSALGGGAIYAWQHNEPTLYNCILWGNRATTGEGDQIKLNTSSGTTCTLTIATSVLEGGRDDVWVSDPTWCVIDWGDGMLETDPDFADPGAGDYRLLSTSPCIDAGDNTAVLADTADLDDDGDAAERTPLDLDRNPRFVDDPFTDDTGLADPPSYPEIVDIGAYELPFCLGDLDGDGVIGLADLATLLAHYGVASGAAYADGDLDGDGAVGLADLATLLAAYGTTCP